MPAEKTAFPGSREAAKKNRFLKGAMGSVYSCRGVPVWSVNQWFQREACLELFKLSVVSLQANWKCADKLFSPLLLHIWADINKQAQHYSNGWMNLVGVDQAVGHLLGLLPKHTIITGLIWKTLARPFLHPSSTERCWGTPSNLSVS